MTMSKGGQAGKQTAQISGVWCVKALALHSMYYTVLTCTLLMLYIIFVLLL